MDNGSQSIAETGSPRRSIAVWDLASVTNLPDRIDDQTISSLKALLASPPLQHEPATQEHFDKCIKVMEAMLPMRRVSDESGELMARTYERKLGGLTKGALSFLSSQAIERCDWFPTVKECREILADYVEPPLPDAAVRSLAAARIERERNLRFGDAIAALTARTMPQDQIDALPEQWKAIAAEKCLLWRWPDGRYTPRADMERLGEDEAAAERERVQAMFAEWERITAGQVAA